MSSQNSQLYFSTAQTHFGHVLSHVVFYPAADAPNQTVIRNWFLSKYNGTIVQTQTVSTYQYINSDPKTYQCRKIAAPIHDIDIELVNQDGAITCEHGSLEITVKFAE